MNKINERSRYSILRKVYRVSLVPTLLLLIALVMILSPTGDNPPDNTITLSAFESQKLAEISYISSSLIGATIIVDNTLFARLATGDTTEFEDNDEQINLYFDTLKVFLEDENFYDSVTVTVLLEGSEFDQLIEFELNGNIYQFYITIEDGVITGELTIGIKTFAVTGTFEETTEELKIVLEATNGNDYINIEYKTESEDEIESNYQIQQRINGIESSKEIKISIEDEESKVEIKEGQNEYTLQKEIEDGVVQYKLEYKINGTEGSATISEQVDVDGNVSYNYRVSEGDEEKDVHHNKPDYDYDDEEDDEEDDEDGNGNNDDDRGNNPNDEEDDEPEEEEQENNSLPTTYSKDFL
jgi:hypothetical protein